LRFFRGREIAGLTSPKTQKKKGSRREKRLEEQTKDHHTEIGRRSMRREIECDHRPYEGGGKCERN